MNMKYGMKYGMRRTKKTSIAPAFLEVGQMLAAARIKSGLSQSEVARYFEWATAQFVSNWERGLSFPPKYTLDRLTELYGTEAVDKCVAAYIDALIADLKKYWGKV